MADALVDLEGPDGPRSLRWAQRILATSCLVLASAGLLGLMVVGDSVSPATVLARMQAFVEDAKTARITAENTTEHRDGSNGVGSTFTDVSRMSGSLVLPDSSQWVEDDGSSVYEEIVLPGHAYSRQADRRQELGKEQWVHTALGEQPGPGATPPELMAAARVASAFGATDLIDMLSAAERPERVAPHVIKATIDVQKLKWFETEDPDMPVPTITAQLTSSSEGRLDRLVLRTVEDDEEGSFSNTSDIRFSDWGAPITIVAPGRDAIDPTPGIDENGLAAFHATPLFGLRNLPAGYELLEASVYTSEEDADPEGGECPEVSLSYGNPAEEAAAEVAAAKASEEDYDSITWPTTLDVSLTPASCDGFGALDGGQPITVGGRKGTIVRSSNTHEEYATSIEVVVGTTRVLIESDGPEAATIAAASALVPFDLASQPVHREALPD